jgi:hypothetical protein
MLKVPARSNRCQRCQEPFQGQQPVVSFLVFGEEVILRSDCCEICAPEAQAQMQQKAGDRPVASWRTKTEAAGLAPSVPDSLLGILRPESDARPGLQWLLALYLERQRILVLQSEQSTSAAHRWYEYPETGETFQVISSTPDRQDLHELQRLMAALPSEARQAG